MSTSFSDNLAARLPSPRGDEPAGLRQDILDELTDHLTSSYHRELLRGLDPTAAKARVLEHFGDPAEVARRLWLDAMRGKIMVQRVIIGTCVVVTAVSVAAVGFLWREAIAARRAAAVERAVAHAREQEVLKQLSAMSEAIRHPRSLDWNPLSFKLTEDTPTGPPAAGVDLMVYRTDAVAGQPLNRALRSDKNGVVDLGLVNPGNYEFFIANFRMTSGRFTQARGQLLVAPGSETVKHIVCPRSPPQEAAAKVKVAWPDDLEKEGLLLCVSFAYDSRVIADVPWHDGVTHSVLFDRAAPPLELVKSRFPYLWSPSSGTILADIPAANLHPPDEKTGSFQWEAGSYDISRMLVLRPEPPAAGVTSKRFQVVAGSTAPILTGSAGFLINSEPPETHQPGSAPPERPAARTNRIPITPYSQSFGGVGEAWGKASGGLEIRPGKLNEWTVSLWDELVKLVREQLKSAKSPKSGQTGPR